MRYRLRTLLSWLQKHDIARVQVTLVLGCLGVGAAYGCWLEFEWHGWPDFYRLVAAILGFISVAAIVEGAWKLAD